MKKSIVLFSLCAILMASVSTFAQDATKKAPTCSKENTECTHQCHQPQILTPATIAMLKEEFFKENLKLNDNQKDAFWKSYHKYENAKKQANENAKAAMEKAGLPAHHGCKSHHGAKLTDEQKVAKYGIQLEKRQALLTAEQNFFKEISKNLSNEQIAQYLDLEKTFHMEMAKLNGKSHCQHQECGSHGGTGCGSQPKMGPKGDSTPKPGNPLPTPRPVREMK